MSTEKATPKDGRGINRRSLFGLAAAGAVAAGAVSATNASSARASTLPTSTSLADEDAILDTLYAAAVAEGGSLWMFDGGDYKEQQDGVNAAFLARFPKMTLTNNVDLSKYHDGHVDNLLARGEPVPDLVRLQTLQDFPRWKQEGQLLPYRPLGWAHVYPTFKDASGYYTALNTLAFSNVSNPSVISATAAPRDALDYLDPSLAGKLVFTWPNDDDGVLYCFKNVIDKYGWTYMDRLMRQDPVFVRGVGTTVGMIASGQKAATFGAPSSLTPNAALSFQVPRKDVFVSWGQTAAILKRGLHPAAARLFMSWSLSTAVQQTAYQWPVRNDVAAANGYRPLLDYNTHPDKFRAFMEDRAAAEVFRSQIRLYVGDPTGPDPAITS